MPGLCGECEVDADAHKKGLVLLVCSVLSVLPSESQSCPFAFPSPGCIFVSAGFPFSFWPWRFLALSFSVSFLVLWVFCGLIFSVSFFWFGSLAVSDSTSPIPSYLSAQGLPAGLPPWEACCQRLRSSLSVSGGLLPLRQSGLPLPGIGVAPPPRHVVGRRGPVQAGPLPSYHLRPLLHPRCLAEADEPQGPLKLREKLGAKLDICSHLIWERNFRASRLWLDWLVSRDSVCSSYCFRGGGRSQSPRDPEGSGRVLEDLESLLILFIKFVWMSLLGKERAVSFHPILKRTLNPTNVQLHERGLRLPAPVLRPSFFFSL